MLLQHPCEGADAQAAEANPSFQLKCYPTSLIDIWQLHCGTRVTMRPVLPQDSALLGELIGRLYSNSRRNRFHAAVNRLSAAQLRQMSCVDYQQHMALVITTAKHGQEQVIAEARYFVDEPGQDDIAQFAITVDDRWQRRGLGRSTCHADPGQGCIGGWSEPIAGRSTRIQPAHAGPDAALSIRLHTR